MSTVLGSFQSYAEQTSVLAVQSILAGVAVVNANAIFGSRGEHGGSVWLTIGIYNAQAWFREEYAAIVYIGKQRTPSPWKDLEDEFLDMGMNDPCKKIEEYIRKMKEQIKWREGDLSPSSASYKGHLYRIKRLKDQVKLLAGYLAMGFCRKGK